MQICYRLRTLLVGFLVLSVVVGLGLRTILQPDQVVFPILGPIQSSDTNVLLDPPNDAEILRVIGASGAKFRIVKTRIRGYFDPPRKYPLVGQAALHHTLYKCTVVDGPTSRVAIVDHQNLRLVDNLKTSIAATQSPLSTPVQ